MPYRIVVCLVAFGHGLSTLAQVAINSLPATHSENFNSLPTNGTGTSTPWTDNSTLPDWYAENEAVEQLDLRYGGTRSTGGSSARGLYSFGDRSIPDMALGVITTNDSDDIAFGIKFQNQSGSDIESVTVSYTGEQWRISDGQRPQVLGFSYTVSNADPTIAIPERTSGYTYVPELFFTSPKFDTTGLNLAGETGIALDGNATANRVAISFSFEVTVPSGNYLLLRWYKENTTKIEFGLGIDDLTVDFSSSTLSSLSFTSQSPIYHYICGPIDLRIPDEDDSEAYDPPTTVESGAMSPEETTFRSLIQNMLGADYAQVRTDAPTIGYELVTFIDATNGNQEHQVLRHNGAVDNPHHWGTYIFNTAPTDGNTHLSIPHPVFDRFTARQGGYLYGSMNLAGIQIAGNYRCSSNTSSGCHGTTSVCSGSTDFRTSDAAHSTEMPFHYASEEIADDDANNFFIQLHGFSHDPGDPDLIVSNGTDQTPVGSDRVADFVSYVDNSSSFNAAGVHSDPYDDKLTGYTNSFGRYLNAHQGDICTSNEIADNSTDRFMHIEQRSELREIESNYLLIENAINQALATPLPLVLVTFDYEVVAGAPYLVWETESASNVDYIEVMASVEGQHFHGIGRRTALNEEERIQYSFRIPDPDLVYFQLKMVDFDTHSEKSEIIRSRTSRVKAAIYPSVITDQLFVEGDMGARVQVFDPMGRIQFQAYLPGRRLEIKTSHWRRGMYILRIHTEEGIISQKLLKYPE